MNCTDFNRILHPYIDGELDVQAHIAAQAHAAECASCGALVSHYCLLGDEIRVAGRSTVPASLLRRIHTLAETTSVIRSRRRWTIRFAIGAVAAGLIVSLSLWISRSAHLDDDDIREVVALTHRSELPGHLVDFETTDATLLAPWFAKRLAFTPWVGQLREEYTLIGSRLDFCDEQRVAVAVFRYNGHIVNVVSYPSEMPGDRAPIAATCKEISLCGWSHHGIQIFVSSDLPPSDIVHVAMLLRS